MFMGKLLKKYLEAKEEKNSVLCVGLDPAPPAMRTGNAVPEDYFKQSGGDEPDGLYSFTMDIIEKTGFWALAYKLNAQYIFPFSIEHYKKLNEAIKKQEALSILDIKVNDIGPSNDACFYWAHKAGFDAVTYSPFAGNIAEAATQAHARDIGLFVLTLMSNPDAGIFMRSCTVKDKPGFEWISSKIAEHKCEGAVIGAANTTAMEIKRARQIMGKDVIFLVPGIGAQGGDAERIFLHGGQNLLINVGRTLIYAKKPAEVAEDFVKSFRKLRRGE
ncbi:hypothetical protein DRN67_03345 [Candidatus Micrarchaeota archaeon]|nr:MAG: hypothetical protein DRN67_03345 [Candidatus Micrarchaeota archaeon]